MADGPDLRDFIVGEVKEKTWTEYQGKLKRDVGDKRLRLPPWLKGNLFKCKNSTIPLATNECTVASGDSIVAAYSHAFAMQLTPPVDTFDRFRAFDNNFKMFLKYLQYTNRA